MLLGYEYDLLSSIACNYHSHENGLIQFDKMNYISNYHSQDPGLKYLEKLEGIGIVKINQNLITIDTHAWVKLFVERLQLSIAQFGVDMTCTYNSADKKIVISKDEESKVEFLVNTENKIPKEEIKFISLCYIDTFEYYIHWLELLNDYNNLELFCSFVKGEINRLTYEKRIIFDFFQGLDDGDLSDIFYITIKNYFEGNGYKVEESPNDSQFIKKVTKIDSNKLFIVERNSHRVLVVYNERKIEFAYLENYEELSSFPMEILGFIKVMEGSLINKVSEYKNLLRLNKLNLFDNTRKTVQLLTWLLVPINLLWTIGNARGYSFITNITQSPWFFWGSLTTSIIIVLFTLYYILLPIYRISKFNWRMVDASK
jgi:hypothetical protein